MEKIGCKVLNVFKDVYEYECPGCNQKHYFLVGGKTIWNDSLLRPSVWPIQRNSIIGTDKCEVMISQGKLHYNENCTHELKGQIVEMIILR